MGVLSLEIVINLKIIYDPSNLQSIKKFLPLGYFKIMVAGGYSANGVTGIAEIVDLETAKSNCSNLPLLPRGGFGAAGSLVNIDNPIVCGGFNYNNFYDR